MERKALMSLNSQHTWVICAYGESQYLEACIQSLKNQTLTSKIICYTSTPLTSIYEICGKYDIPVHHKTGGGIGRDWNQALSFVSTKFATIAHQDDYYEPKFLEKTLEAFEAHQDGLITFTDYFEEKNGSKIDANTNLKIKRLMLGTLSIFPTSRFWRKRVLAFGNPICCPAVSYNLEKLKDFQFDEDMRVSLDWYAWYKINEYKGSFLYIPEALMCHRIHQESETTKTISDNTRTKEDLYMYNLFWPKWFSRVIMKFYVKSQDTNH